MEKHPLRTGRAKQLLWQWECRTFSSLAGLDLTKAAVFCQDALSPPSASPQAGACLTCPGRAGEGLAWGRQCSKRQLTQQQPGSALFGHGRAWGCELVMFCMLRLHVNQTQPFVLLQLCKNN